MSATEFMDAMTVPADRTPENDRRAIISLLREHGRIEREQDEQRGWFESIRGVYHEEEAIRASTLAKIEETIQEIASDLKAEGTQHVDIVGVARLQFTKTPAYLKVRDADALTAWARAHEHPELLEHVPASVKPITVAAKALAESTLAETGEVLAWAEQVPENTTMTIQSREGR